MTEKKKKPDVDKVKSIKVELMNEKHRRIRLENEIQVIKR
jgi:hypothetical protein